MFDLFGKKEEKKKAAEAEKAKVVEEVKEVVKPEPALPPMPEVVAQREDPVEKFVNEPIAHEKVEEDEPVEAEDQDPLVRELQFDPNDAKFKYYSLRAEEVKIELLSSLTQQVTELNKNIDLLNRTIYWQNAQKTTQS